MRSSIGRGFARGADSPGLLAVAADRVLDNGQGGGDTETGTYTLLGGTATPSNADSAAVRSSGATIVLASENEWYKAAYYDALSASYFDYPTRSDTQTVCATPTASANRGNCDNVVGDLTNAGSYTGSASPYGTFDQGGNLYEWNDSLIDGYNRAVRGGTFYNGPSFLASSSRSLAVPTQENVGIGFRLAMIPEPGTGLLVIAGLIGLTGWRRARA